MRGLLRTGSTNYAGTTKTLTSSYLTTADLWEKNPNTLLAWTRDNVDGLEAGVEVVS
jgi:hypothetical protein